MTKYYFFIILLFIIPVILLPFFKIDKKDLSDSRKLD